MLDDEAIREAIAGNNRRNAKLLSVLQEKGVPLNESRGIDLHFWAWSRSDAETLKRALTSVGLDVKDIVRVDEAEEELWSISCKASMSVAVAASQEMTNRNVMLAAEVDCLYDGWGTHV